MPPKPNSAAQKLPYSDIIQRWGVILLWILLSASIFFRCPIPIDETRYLSVAWEMWLRGDFWVPFLNGHTYSHKPPLLFWLFQSGWVIFGVNEWWPRLVGPLCALLNLLLTRKLAQILWPNQVSTAILAPWLLIATLLWTLFATSAMFDILLTCQVLLAMLGVLILSTHQHSLKGTLYIALGLGLGLLSKGPVIFLHVLPTALLFNYWSKPANPYRWLASLGLAVFLGVLLALAWAIPAGILGGSEYAKAIFWQQTADRTINTEIHVRPLLWYVQFCPLILFPWIIWPRFWRNFQRMPISKDKSLSFCLSWFLSTFVVLSLLPSKQIHYLIPILPAFALIAARVLLAFPPPNSAKSDYLISAAFALIGLFLILLPEVPGLSKFKWAQTIDIGWGSSVLLIAFFLAFLTYLHRLTTITISTALVSAIFLGFVFFFKYNDSAFNLLPAAQQLKDYNDRGVACAFVGNYQGQFHFLGRLTQPLETIEVDQVAHWARLHADGFLISLEKEKPVDAIFSQQHREYWLVFRSAHQAGQIAPL